MGELTDKLKGVGNTVSGAVKDAVGSATGNKELEAEGEAQKLKGKVQHETGEIKGALGDEI